jgi:Rad3-related DNA helicase
MTQEELDALMAEGFDDDLEEDTLEDTLEEESKEEKEDEKDDLTIDAQDYKLEGTKAWPPPPPTEDHKVVEQLDDVTRDSEVKATEIFDKLEAISDFIMQVENNANEVLEVAKKDVEIFEKLVDKFPHINVFQERLHSNKEAIEKINDLISNAQMSSDEIMMIMDIMQYQDIHRQKIERVINVIRTLAGYMNSLFSAEKDDSKRVGSAVHIAGDTSTEDVVSNDDIEALIESLGKK